MIDELSALNTIEERFNKASRDVKLGIGDDAAAVKFDKDMLVLTTTDAQVEDVHFIKSLINPSELARKAVAVSVSDIAAMGGIPKFILASVGFSPDENEQYLDQLISGFKNAEDEFGVRLIGGNLSSSEKLFLDITVLGQVEPESMVRRSGARPGDLIYVSGNLGDSALGLKVLSDDQAPKQTQKLIDRHLHPNPRLSLGRELVENVIPASMIDVSDGLLLDLERITLIQELGARIDIEKIPRSQEYIENVDKYCDDKYEMALSGGEDYELLFTCDESRRMDIQNISENLNIQITEIGTVTESTSIDLISSSGEYKTLNKRGFVHFNS
ncbi:MAG: thiamine-phosphate kinase [Thermodesulfobacteriota bacterium]